MLSEISKNDNTIFIHLCGEIDHHTSKEIRENADRLIASSTPDCIVFDFSNVSFMDSSGIGLIMGRYRLANEKGAKVYVYNASEYIKKVIKIAGLYSILEVTDKLPCAKGDDKNEI